MGIARHESGAAGAARALASQVHPVFMLPPLAASAFGAVLARELSPTLAAVHLGAVFCALYTAHVKDGYVDFYARGEDDDHPLTEWGCRRALLASSVGFFALLAVVALLAGPVAALLTLPGWLIGYFHAPQLDVNPVSATAGYPAGIGFALLGGHYVQSGGLSGTVLAFAVVFVVVLSGIKTIDDAKDYEYDRSISKRTVAVVLGPRRARLTAYGLMGAGMLVVALLALLTPVFPPSSVAAALAFAAIAALTRPMPPELATKVLVRGSYVFLAFLVAAVWFRPLA
ncbi:UbiA family prenyltransferase [Halomarina ordinaria]|uniref:UbiA family prenyltransferase n=1 Tax=Halomarina ordinaria TaxID=3033939 RepID=A0ABD5U7L4_9EURY|nr:UbiA family prenyltransferase [Halomarina sp. PSRA2]